MLAEFVAPHRHTECSGCPACRQDFARLLTLTSAEYCQWLSRQREIDYPAALGYLASAPADLVAAIQAAAQQPSRDEQAEQADRVRAFFSGPRLVSAASVSLRTNTAPDVPAPPDLFAAVRERNRRNER